jgi:hypothetical protein
MCTQTPYKDKDCNGSQQGGETLEPTVFVYRRQETSLLRRYCPSALDIVFILRLTYRHMETLNIVSKT